MAEEGSDDYEPHVALDWAPTDTLIKTIGHEKAAAEAENFSRSSAVRHMPAVRVFPKPDEVEENPLLVEGEPAVDTQKQEDAKVLLLCMGIGFLLGIGVLITINYVRRH